MNFRSYVIKSKNQAGSLISQKSVLGLNWDKGVTVNVFSFFKKVERGRKSPSSSSASSQGLSWMTAGLGFSSGSEAGQRRDWFVWICIAGCQRSSTVVDFWGPSGVSVVEVFSPALVAVMLLSTHPKEASVSGCCGRGLCSLCDSTPGWENSEESFAQNR